MPGVVVRRAVAFRKRMAKGAKGTVPVSQKQAERNLSKRVDKLAKSVRLVKPEVKWADCSVSVSNVSTTTGAVTSMLAVSQGTSSANRIGDAIRLISIELNWLPSLATTSVSGNQANSGARFYVVQDQQQIADTAPVGSDFVDQPSLPAIQLTNINFQNRFKILYDSGPQIYSQYDVLPIIPENRSFVRNIVIPCNILVRYNGVASTDYQKNAIYLFVFSNCLVAGSSSFDYTGTARVKFTDV